MPWFVLYTKPRQEKKVAEGLKKLDIEAYCPLVTVMKQWSDRKKKVQVPLINSYVFVKLEEQRRDEVFVINGIVRYLYWLGKPAVVREAEIEAIRNALEGIVSSYEVLPIKKEDRITITKGPFKGMEGIVKQVSKTNIQLVLSDLGFFVSIRKEEV
ncbi:MAG: UpxY family transcription antiterminator [Flavobacterium sp.]